MLQYLGTLSCTPGLSVPAYCSIFRLIKQRQYVSNVLLGLQHLTAQGGMHSAVLPISVWRRAAPKMYLTCRHRCISIFPSAGALEEAIRVHWACKLWRMVAMARLRFSQSFKAAIWRRIFHGLAVSASEIKRQALASVCQPCNLCPQTKSSRPISPCNS